MHDFTADNGERGRESRQVVSGTGKGIGRIGDEIGLRTRGERCGAAQEPGPCRGVEPERFATVDGVVESEDTAGVFRVVMPCRPRSGSSGPMGWSVPALIQACGQRGSETVAQGLLDGDVHT